MSDKTLNIDVEVIYHWYDEHRIFEADGKKEIIEQAITEGDFETFLTFYKTYNQKNGCFFPSIAELFFQNELVGYIHITHPTGFSLITESKYNRRYGDGD